MNKLLSQVKVETPNKNWFDLSHDVKSSMSMGKLYPILTMPVLPGDMVKLDFNSMVRCLPMVVPPMQRMDIYIHAFYVPNYIIWENFRDFVGQVKNDNGDLPVHPRIPVTDDTNYELLDHMGIPPWSAVPNASVTENINPLPMAAYAKIWNEYYRDQNLQDKLVDTCVDGWNQSHFTAENWKLQRRAKPHDYFTSQLPSAQKGDPVQIPIGNNNNVPIVINQPDGVAFDDVATTDNIAIPSIENFQPAQDPNFPSSTLLAKTSDLDATAVNVIELRRLEKLQAYLEKIMRAGGRWIEQLKSIWNVQSSDKSLQRPQYICGTQSPIVISEVLNTAGGDVPQGTMAGHGFSVGTGNGGSVFCEEHGWVIAIASIVPQTGYHQGIPRFLNAPNSPFDYPLPDFANIGEQETHVRELYAYTTASNDTFGYMVRYGEYKMMNNRIAGAMRDNLSQWHLYEHFNNVPTLSSEFIECKPSKRIFAVTDDDVDCLITQVFNNVSVHRSLPYFGNPSFTGNE